MHKHIIFLVALLALNACTLFSQDYKTSLGFRGGWTSGISFKHFVKEDAALEVIFSSGWRNWSGYQLTGLYEIHKPAFLKDNVKGLFWFYGAGAHLATGYRVWHYTANHNDGYWDRYSAVGVDGIFGLEYKIEEVPITLGIDVKPFFEIATNRDAPFGFWDGAFTIRYVF